MKLVHTVKIYFDEQEVEAWNTILLAIAELDRQPCEDEGASNAISNLYDAMTDFLDYSES